MKLIVDSGATKTDWCAIRQDGTIGHLRTEGVNLTTMPSKSIDNYTQRAIAALNTNYELVSEVHIYAAGLLEPRTSGNVEYASDLLAAARALCGHQSGIVAIMGTGSNSCLYDGQNVVKNVRSGGFILGDEGSAACLGKMFISDFLKGLVPKEVAEELEASFKVDYNTVVRNVYKGEAPSRYLGSFAPWLIERDSSCEYIRDLIKHNFKLFIDRALCRYDCKNYPVGLVGGFVYSLKDVFSEVASSCGIRISCIEESPMKGLIEYHSND